MRSRALTQHCSQQRLPSTASPSPSATAHHPPPPVEPRLAICSRLRSNMRRVPQTARQTCQSGESQAMREFPRCQRKCGNCTQVKPAHPVRGSIATCTKLEWRAAIGCCRLQPPNIEPRPFLGANRGNASNLRTRGGAPLLFVQHNCVAGLRLARGVVMEHDIGFVDAHRHETLQSRTERVQGC